MTLYPRLPVRYVDILIPWDYPFPPVGRVSDPESTDERKGGDGLSPSHLSHGITRRRTSPFGRPLKSASAAPLGRSSGIAAHD